MITLQSTLYLVVALVVLGVVAWGVDYLVRTVPIGDPLGRVIRIVVMVVCIICAIALLLGWAGMLPGRTVAIVGA